MHLPKRSLVLATLLGVLTLAPASVVAHSQQNEKPLRYSVTALGTLGGTFSQGGGLNNRGAVAGFSTLSGNEHVHAFRWEHGVMTDLGTLGGPDSFTQESDPINDRGMVTGYSETSKPDPNGEDFCGAAAGIDLGRTLTCLPFVWQKGRMTALPTLGGGNGFASGINNRGQIAGVSETNHPDPTCAPTLDFHFEAVLWQNGNVRELPPFPGDADGAASVVNEKGQVVGASGPCTSAFGNAAHALLWQDGKPIDLGNLGGTIGNQAFDINNRGQVVGTSALPGNLIHDAFLWQNGKMIRLGGLPGAVFSLANGINNKGQVVGFSSDASGNNTAWLWQDGVMTDLNTLIPPGSPLFLLEALGINDRGQIAGYGVDRGHVHGYLLTPCGGNASAAPESCHVSPLAAAASRLASEGITERPTNGTPSDAVGVPMESLFGRPLAGSRSRDSGL